MSRDTFTFAGTSSNTYGVVIQRRPDYVTPTKVVETFSVRGRSGDLVIDTGAYENVPREYEIFVPHAQRSAFMNWIRGQVGYQRLTDTYDPEVYRMALLTDALTLENVLGQFGTAKLEFNCKPQRFLISGETEITISSPSYTLTNDYEVALPLIKLTGYNTLTLMINNNAITITGCSSNEVITIDAEAQNIYSGTNLINNRVSLTNNFPVLEKGTNVINYSQSTGVVNSCKITPRWWKL